MKRWERIEFGLPECRREVDDLGALLAEREELSEAADVLPFFADRKALSAAIGLLNPLLPRPDRLAHEYDLFGDFRCDLAVGQEGVGQFCLVEFEDARRASVFSGPKGTPDWARRFEHGMSQVIDWFWKLEDERGSTEFQNRFGYGEAGFVGILVIGRRAFLDRKGEARLRWRRESVTVGRHGSVLCLTYDELHSVLDQKLAAYGF